MNETRASSRAWCIEWIMFLTYAFFAVNWIAGSTLTPQIMESFGLTSMASASMISNAITIAKIIGNFLAASILVKLLPKKAIGLGSLLILAGCIVAIVAGSYPVFILGRFIMGFGGAIYVVYFSPMVLHYFTGQQRAVVNSLNGVAYNFGSVVAMIVVTPVILWLKTWRYSMMFFAAISAVLFILWLVMGENFPLQQTTTKEKYSMGQALKEKLNWLLPLTYSGLLTFYLVMITLYPISGLSVIDSKIISTLVAFGGIVGALAAIWLAKVYHRRLPVIRWCGLALTAFGALMLFIPNAVVQTVSAFLIGVVIFLPVTSLMLIPQELPGMTPSRLTTVMGLFWAISYIIETILYFIIGRVIDSAGYQAGLIIALAVSLTFFIGSFLLPETSNHKQEEKA